MNEVKSIKKEERYLFSYILINDKDNRPKLKKERRYTVHEEGIVRFSSSEAIVDYCDKKFFMSQLTEEKLLLVATNAKNEPVALFELSRGSIRGTVCDVAGIFRRLVLTSASSFFILHNHPSGDSEPSTDDHRMFSAIEQSSKMMGYTFVDNIIIGSGNYFSFRANEKKIF